MLRSQTADLANGLYLRYKIGEQDTVLVFSPNHIHYPVAMWAIHKLGGVVSFSNPQFKPDEVAYQLRTAHVTYMVVHSSLLVVALEAARLAGMPSNRIIILDEVPLSRDVSEIQTSLRLSHMAGKICRHFMNVTRSWRG
ncbi:hypothetical protein CPB84DRAFT_702136 [Gymnopilus junonius]|uniref:AMP-dependent synthetase/ligase domain-containing protein n=1 Tax=Gymnopilus junonius TaxID=109634 RepID=A0A9P5TNY1_GYMJU|nr:hypothetical protein CPB84DRAFT_702136 [Gymnopilus junonius]